MKKTIALLLLIVSVVFPISAQNADKVSLVNGVWSHAPLTFKEINLYETQEGTPVKLATYYLNEAGNFHFAFSHQKEGFYLIGVESNHQAHQYCFYFKPGDELNFKVAEAGMELTGKNTAENQVMSDWYKLIDPMDRKIFYRQGNSDYKDFFPLLEQTYPKVQAFKANTKNKTFNAMFDSYKELDFADCALHLFVTPRTAHPGADDIISYYQEHADITKLTALPYFLEYPYAVDLSLIYPMAFSGIYRKEYPTEKMVEIVRNPETYLDFFLPKYSNDIAKGALTLSTLRRARTLDTYQALYGKYGNLLTDAQKKHLPMIQKRLMEKAAEEARTTPAVDFSFKDVDGKEISLSSFKGKMVLVDVWATWCGPCRRQMPYLKELEKNYHGKDIVFLGVSVDKSSDYNKWKDFLVKEEMTGVQLFAGDEAKDKLMTPYNIVSIPRFILIGKDGSVVSMDAPQPSTPDLKIMIDKFLK